MATMTMKTIDELCIENGWFTCGTQEQYGKLVEANMKNRSLRSLATIIWVCTRGWRCRDICKMLEDAAEAEEQVKEDEDNGEESNEDNEADTVEDRE